MNTSKSVISGYEKGLNDPSQSAIKTLADALDVSVNYLMNAPGNELPLTIQRAVGTMKNLNDEGQTKVADYADDLDKSGQYKAAQPKLTVVEGKKAKKPQVVEEKPDEYFVPMEDTETLYSASKASAGPGVWGGDDDTIRVRKDDYRPPYDDAIIVKGDSMEPTIPNGSVAFVRRDLQADNGRIVVASYDDQIYIKRLRNDGWGNISLQSDNAKYAPIKVKIDRDDPYNFRIIGVVVDHDEPVDLDQLL